MRPQFVFGIVVVALFAAGIFASLLNRPLSFYYSQPTASEAALQNETLPAATSTATSTELRIPIIIYHSVHSVGPTATLMQQRFNVPPDIFEAQLRYLRDNGYTTITMAELRKEFMTGTSSGKEVALTFDDGWMDQYTTVLPLLEKYGDVATFYVYTNPIGKDRRFLTWDELAQMQAAGMLIGSHTLSHPYLQKISPEQLHHEIFDSKAVLEQHLGAPVVDFASPFGYSDDALVALLKQAGYETGRTTYKGNMHGAADLLRLTGYFAPQTVHDLEWIVRFAP